MRETGVIDEVNLITAVGDGFPGDGLDFMAQEKPDDPGLSLFSELSPFSHELPGDLGPPATATSTKTATPRYSRSARWGGGRVSGAIFCFFFLSYRMAPTGHTSEHFPHPTQISGFISATPWGESWIAPTGHSPMQIWQAMQRSEMTSATSIPFVFRGMIFQPFQRSRNFFAK